VDEREALKKETMDLRRTVSEELYEKEAIQKTANELRGTVKKLEADKVDNGRAIQDLKQRIARASHSYLLTYLCPVFPQQFNLPLI